LRLQLATEFATFLDRDLGVTSVAALAHGAHFFRVAQGLQANLSYTDWLVCCNKMNDSSVPQLNPKTDTRTKLLDAALTVIRMKGYSATSVEELCTTADVTKGAFFHHFRVSE